MGERVSIVVSGRCRNEDRAEGTCPPRARAGGRKWGGGKEKAILLRNLIKKKFDRTRCKKYYLKQDLKIICRF